MPRSLDRLLSITLGVALVAACHPGTSNGPAPTSASATLRDASGATVGTVTLSQTNTGVLLSGSVSGIGTGTHGIHVHAVGRCDPPFQSAGGHFNPDGKQHGFRNPAGPHAGDMTNISIPPGGTLTFDLLLPHASLGGSHGMLDADGASVVIHASADDYTTDPAGNSGARIACGVITAR